MGILYICSALGLLSITHFHWFGAVTCRIYSAQIPAPNITNAPPISPEHCKSPCTWGLHSAFAACTYYHQSDYITVSLNISFWKYHHLICCKFLLLPFRPWNNPSLSIVSRNLICNLPSVIRAVRNKSVYTQSAHFLHFQSAVHRPDVNTSPGCLHLTQ